VIVGILAALVASASASAIDKPEVISVLVLPVRVTPLGELDFEKLKAGDHFGFAGVMYSWSGRKRGNRIGRIEGQCQVVSAVSARGAGTLYCASTAFLPGGRILFEGHDHLGTTPKSFPITGGTGRYADARGSVTTKDIGFSGKAANVFRLLP
jgi:hypothetical protein